MPDSQEPATKSDIQRLDQRVDKLDQRVDKLDQRVDKLDQKFDRMAVTLVKTQAEVREIKHTIATNLATKEDISRVLSAIDAFARKAEAYDRKAFSHGDILQNHEEKLRDHHRRLTSLESKA